MFNETFIDEYSEISESVPWLRYTSTGVSVIVKTEDSIGFTI
jgi:hypothetical protein